MDETFISNLSRVSAFNPQVECMSRQSLYLCLCAPSVRSYLHIQSCADPNSVDLCRITVLAHHCVAILEVVPLPQFTCVANNLRPQYSKQACQTLPEYSLCMKTPKYPAYHFWELFIRRNTSHQLLTGRSYVSSPPHVTPLRLPNLSRPLTQPKFGYFLPLSLGASIAPGP